MRILTICLVLAAGSQLGATDCDGGITRDPGFDLWCGDALCAWKLERGAIRRAPTWHPDDAGVELVEPDTAIEQFTPATSRDGTCIRFDLIADVAEDAQAELAIDIYGDGSIERAFPIPTASWKPISFRFALAAPYTGVRFEIAKQGPGRAVVARMRAFVIDEGCAGIPALTGGPAPLGALCKDNRECASALCAAVEFPSDHGRCAGCDPFAPQCETGQVCGYIEPGPAERSVPIACVAEAARVLGEECLSDGECATGMCSVGVCSTCDPNIDQPCAGGLACRSSYDVGPYLCGARDQRGAPGAPCGADSDCMSGTCSGPARQQCLDGRACVTDFNCPVDGSLRHLPCDIVGIQGGRCD
jgi:hypothetical protein